MHHLIFDGVSLYRVILPEIVTVYDAFLKGEGSPLQEPQVQYSDYAVWARSQVKRPENARSLQYWRKQLEGSQSLALPMDNPRPARQRFRGGMEPFRITKDIVDRLDSFSLEVGATFFQTIASAFAVLLGRYSGQDDITFGTIIDLRDRPEFENMVGYCLSPMVVRVDLSNGPTFPELIARVRETLLTGMEHKVTFPQLVQAVHRGRDPGANPIFQCMVVLEPQVAAPESGWSLHQIDADFGAAAGHAKVDLHMELDRRPEGDISGRLIYNSDLFEPPTARRMVRHWITLLQGIALRPDRVIADLPLLTEEELQQQLVEWNATLTKVPDKTCIHEIFAEQARVAPDKPAVEFRGEALTYGELDRWSNAVAYRLRNAGAGRGTVVALCLERSVETVVAMLATLKSGAAYLPLDHRYPAERLSFMLRDSGATIVVTQQGLVDRLPLDGLTALCIEKERWDQDQLSPRLSPPSVIAPDSVAYVIYTSGSTGRPKGVAVKHSSVVNLMTTLARHPGLDSADRFLAVVPFTFDVSGGDVWVTLGAGATLILASPEQASDDRELGLLIETSGATVMQATPATWEMLIAGGWAGQPTMVALCGGEELTPTLAAGLLDRTGELWNMYGPTETTVWSMCEHVERGKDVSIGRPIGNTRVYILDWHLMPVPVGVSGELFIGGAGVAVGYVNRPELTSERFLPSPFNPDERIYRTGDLARFLPDGRVAIQGRVDYQVKVRGFRVEPGEVESAIMAHPGIRQALVMSRRDVQGSSLVAYIVGHNRGHAPPASELRDQLQGSLPSYMMPSSFVELDALPLTLNGKVDRSALPDPAYRGDDYRAPESDLEAHLASLFAEVLGLERVGLDDDFFELGGHSLLALHLLRRIEQDFNVRLPLVSIFEQGSTVAGMASLVAAGDALSQDRRSVVVLHPEGSSPTLFFTYPSEVSVVSLRHFARLLGADQPLMALLPDQPGQRFDISRTIEELAEPLVAVIREAQPVGPYYLAGFSFGGLLAYEIAGRLMAAGEDVAWLGVLDCGTPDVNRRLLWINSRRGFFARVVEAGPRALVFRATKIGRNIVTWPFVRLGVIRPPFSDDFDWRGALELGAKYRCHGLQVHLDLFASADSARKTGNSSLGWDAVHKGQMTVHSVPGTHLALVTQPHVELVAGIIRESLGRAQLAPNSAEP
jgi:amino acid adenylation domain-containing protein